MSNRAVFQDLLVDSSSDDESSSTHLSVTQQHQQQQQRQQQQQQQQQQQRQSTGLSHLDDSSPEAVRRPQAFIGDDSDSDSQADQAAPPLAHAVPEFLTKRSTQIVQELEDEELVSALEAAVEAYANKSNNTTGTAHSSSSVIINATAPEAQPLRGPVVQEDEDEFALHAASHSELSSIALDPLPVNPTTTTTVEAAAASSSPPTQKENDEEERKVAPVQKDGDEIIVMAALPPQSKKQDPKPSSPPRRTTTAPLPKPKTSVAKPPTQTHRSKSKERLPSAAAAPPPAVNTVVTKRPAVKSTRTHSADAPPPAPLPPKPKPSALSGGSTYVALQEMYQRAVRNRERQNERLSQAREAMEKANMSDCTFAPAITDVAQKLPSRSASRDRPPLSKQHIAEMRESAARAALKDCTFRPAVDSGSAALVEKVRSQSAGQCVLNAGDRLHRDAHRRHEQAVVAANEEIAARATPTVRRSVAEIEANIARLQSAEEKKQRLIERLQAEEDRRVRSSSLRSGRDMVTDTTSLVDRLTKPPKRSEGDEGDARSLPVKPQLNVVTRLLAERKRRDTWRLWFDALSGDTVWLSLLSWPASFLAESTAGRSIFSALQSEPTTATNRAIPFDQFATVLQKYEKCYGPQPYSSLTPAELETQQRPQTAPSFAPLLSERSRLIVAAANGSSSRSGSVHERLYEQHQPRGRLIEEPTPQPRTVLKRQLAVHKTELSTLAADPIRFDKTVEEEEEEEGMDVLEELEEVLRDRGAIPPAAPELVAMSPHRVGPVTPATIAPPVLVEVELNNDSTVLTTEGHAEGHHSTGAGPSPVRPPTTTTNHPAHAPSLQSLYESAALPHKKVDLLLACAKYRDPFGKYSGRRERSEGEKRRHQKLREIGQTLFHSQFNEGQEN